MASPAFAPPGGVLEICFSFDTTISMTSYVDQVKARLQDMVQRLKSDIPGIRIALFTHADYYQPDFDNKNPYVTRHLDFTDDVEKLCTFIKDSVPTTGGDWEECYELVMKEARELLTWTPGTNRVLVLIGDARPHPLEDFGVYFKEKKIDWEEEVKKLLNSNIRSYGVYCKTPSSAAADKKFFKTLSERGDGSFLELKNFDSIFDFMMAICYREHGEDALFAYEAEVRGRSGGAAKDVHNMLTTLKKSVSNASTEGASKIAAVKESKPRAKKPTAQLGKKTKPQGTTNAAAAKPKNTKGRNTKPTVPKTTIKTKGKVTPAKSNKTERKVSATKEANKGLSKVGKQRLAQYKAKTKVPKQIKLRREKVPETNFALRDFPWSKWRIVWSSESRKSLIPTIQRIGNKDKVIDYSARDIFREKTKCHALYEFAVKPKGSRQKKVVYAKISPGFSSYTEVWWKVLFPFKSLRKQISNIVQKQGGDIFVRRLILKKYQRYAAVPTVMKNYDYAWVPEDGAEKYRELMKDSYVISEEMDVD